MTEPTDDEIVALAIAEGVRVKTGTGAIRLVRAALSKWGTPAPVGVEPVAWLSTDCIGERYLCFTKPKDSNPARPLVFGDTTPQPTQAQAGAVPLDEARRLFDAGWKAAALFCDREDVVADGIIGFGACPQFEAAFSATHGIGIKGGQP